MKFPDSSVLSLDGEGNRRMNDLVSKSAKRLFLLLDGLEPTWPRVVVLAGVVLEMVQVLALILSRAFPWGSEGRKFFTAFQFTMLPFWEENFILYSSFAVNGVFLLLLMLALIGMWVLLLIEYIQVDVRAKLKNPQFTKIVVYALSGPLFLPSLQLILALSVCTGANGNQTENTLANFPKEKCLSSAWNVIVFIMAAICLPLLIIPRLVLSLAVFDDNPMSTNIRARPHSITEGWQCVFYLLLSTLYHYLPAIGEREALAGIISASCFFLMALHIFYMPFYNHVTNAIRVVGYAIAFVSSLLMVIVLAIGKNTPLYRKPNAMFGIVLPLWLVVGVITYALSGVRVSHQHKRDIDRARHGEIRRGKFVRRMFYPWYLPNTELRKFHATNAVLNARASVTVVDSMANAALSKSGLTSAGSSTLNYVAVKMVHRDIEEMQLFEMTAYINSIYVATDVELASRFLVTFTRVINTTPPSHLLEFAINMYNKGLNRFVNDSWLELHFAIFLCNFFTSNNHVSQALCEDLRFRQLGPILAYRLHRCASRISDQRIRRNQAAQQHFSKAQQIHKAALVNMLFFWKRMLSERIDLAVLSETSVSVITGCDRGVRYYTAAICQKTDPMILLCYGNFLTDVVLAPDAGNYAKEVAADAAIKQEQGIQQEDLTDDKIISGKQKLGARYNRVSRQLQWFMIISALINLGLMIALAVIIILTYFSTVRILDCLYAGFSFRFYAYRSLWLASIAANTTTTSSLWTKLESDLAELRSLYSQLTYGTYKAKNGEPYEDIQGRFFTVFYGKNKYTMDNTGIWIAGEVVMNALENLVAYRTSSVSRYTASELVSINELHGASLAFNTTLVSYQEQGNDHFKRTIATIAILYACIVTLLIVTMFMFRYFLVRITGMGSTALGLFRLIPKNSIHTIVEHLNYKIEHFEERDPELARMTQDRYLRGYLGVAVHDTHADQASSSTSSESSPEFATLFDSAQPPGILKDDAVGSKFELLARNSSVADVGRIKIHQGEYETPYPKHAFPPPQLTEEERTRRRDQISDLEVERLMMDLRRSRDRAESGTGNQMDETSIYYAPVNIGGSDHQKRQSITVALALLALSCAVVIGVLDILSVLIIAENRDTPVPTIYDMNIFEQTMLLYVTALEGFIYQCSHWTADTISLCSTALDNVKTAADNFNVALVEFSQRRSAERNVDFTSAFGEFSYFIGVVSDQLFAAAKIACSEVSSDDITKTIGCTYFKWFTYDYTIFFPNRSLDLVFTYTVDDLPQDWEVDSLLDDTEKTTLVMNVLGSEYYVMLLNETTHSWHKARNAIVSDEEMNLLDDQVKKTNIYKKVNFGLAILLVFAMLGVTFEAYHYAKYSLLFLLCIFLSFLSLGLLGLQVFFFTSKLPLDGPYKKAVNCLASTSSLYLLQMNAHEGAKWGAFTKYLSGTVQFAEGYGQLSFQVWNEVVGVFGPSYVEDLGKVYSAIQYCFYLDTIVARLAITYNTDYTSTYDTLPILDTVQWDLSRDVEGQRLSLRYDGTGQLLYSDKTTDLALPAADQKALALSLAFGDLRSSTYNEGTTRLNHLVSKYVEHQMEESSDRLNLQLPIMITATAVAFFVAFISGLIVLYLTVKAMEQRHTQQRVGTSSRNLQLYDRGFTTIINWTSVYNTVFFVMLTFLCVFLTTHYALLLNSFREVNLISICSVQVLAAEISIWRSVTYPWYRGAAYHYAETAVNSADQYYRTVKLNFYSDIPRLLFGSVDNVTLIRYNKDLASRTDPNIFSEQSPIIAFGGYVDPSERNYRQRILEIIHMSSASNRYNQLLNLREDFINLTNISYFVAHEVVKDMQHNRKMWMIGNMVVLVVTMILFLLTVGYMLLPVLRRLRREEEGTQVVLQMIPPSIRNAIPAISQYMKTGKMSRDYNAVEVDQISKDLTVVPIITINTAGLIVQFSRAAEETFLWLRNEVIGQNVRILMPDNIAAEHNSYLQRYLKTGVKTMIGASRTIRAKRKDGTLFTAVLEVSEFHTGSEILFVGAFHVSQAERELEQQVALSKALAESSTVPIIIIDTDGVILNFSKAAEEVFKYSQGDVVGQKVNVLMPRVEAEAHDRYLQRYLESSKKTVLDRSTFVRAKRMNGEIFPARITIKELKTGGHTFFVGYVEDFTARLRLEMTACAGTTMGLQSPSPLLVTTIEGTIVQVSNSLKKVCGYDPSEMVQRNIRELIRDDSVLELVEKAQNNPRGLQAHLDEVHTATCTVNHRTEDGQDATFQARVTTRLFLWHTKGPHLMVFIEDLTNLHTLDLNCRIGNVVLALSTVPIVVVSDSGNIVQMSVAAEQSFRCFAGDAYGKNVDMLFETEDPPRSSDGSSGSTGEEEESGGSSDGSHQSKNPIARVLEDYHKEGSTALCGRQLKGMGRTVDYGTSFPVEVLVKEVDQGSQRLFIAYIRNVEDDYQLLEATRWNDAYMAITPIPVVCSDLEGVIFACSDSTCNIFGWTREELIGSPISVLMPPRHAAEHSRYLEQYRETLDTAYKGGERKSLLNRSSTFMGRVKDGAEIPVLVTLRDVHLDGGESFIVASLRPSQQDMELTSLSRVSATMAALSPYPFICIDSYGIITEFSRSALEIFGYAEHEVVGENVSMLMTPEVAEHHDGYLKAYQKTGIKRMVDQTAPVVAKKKDGTLMNIEVSVKESRHGNSSEFISYVHDITGKQTAQQLVTLENLVAAESTYPMLELDVNGVIVDARCVEVELGYREDELIGVPLSQVLTSGEEADVDWSLNAVNDLLNAQKEASSLMSRRTTNWDMHRVFACHKDGHRFWCEVVMGEIIGGGQGDGQGDKSKRAQQKGGRPDGRVSTHSDARAVLFLKNLHREVSLEITHGINNATTLIFPLPLITLTLDGVLTMFNPAAEETFSYTAREALGKPLAAFLMAEEESRLYHALELLKSPSSEAFSETVLDDLMIRRKGGVGPASMHLTLQRMVDLNNQVYFMGTFRDLLSDRAAETEEMLSDALVTFSPIPIMVTNQKAIIEQFSAGAQEFLGYPQLEMEGKDAGMIQARHRSVEKQGETFADFFRVNMSFNEETILPVSIKEHVIVKRKDGVEVHAIVHIHSFVPFKQKAPRFIAYMLDMTQSVLLDQPFLAANMLFEKSLSGVLVIAPHGVVQESNPAAEAMLGYTKEELRNLPLKSLIDAKIPTSTRVLAAANQVVRDTRANGMTSMSAVNLHKSCLLHKDGTLTSMEAIVTSVLPSGGGERLRVAVNFIDTGNMDLRRRYEDRERFLEGISGITSIEIDMDGRVLRVSDSFLRALEFTEADVVGKPYDTFTLKGDSSISQGMERAKRAADKGEESSVDYLALTMIAKNNVGVRMEGEMKSVLRADGTLSSIACRLHSVRMLDTQLAQLALSAVDASNCALVMVTIDGAILASNRLVHALFEIPTHVSVVGQSISMFFPADGERQIIDNFDHLLHSEESEIVRGVLYSQFSAEGKRSRSGHPVGSTFPMEVRMTEMKDDRSSMKGSHTRAPKKGKDRNSTAYLLRFRKVNDKLNMILMRTAMDLFFGINPHSTFMIDDTGKITVWCAQADNLFHLPNAVGSNVLESLFDSTSATQLKGMLSQFRKNRALNELDRPNQFVAYVYAAPVLETSTSAATVNSHDGAGYSTNRRQDGPIPTTNAVSTRPVGTIDVEVYLKEARDDQGVLVNNELLCYVRPLA